MPRLQQALHIPAIVSTDNRLIVPGIEVLCIVLRRLSFPTRLDDLGKEFGHEGSEISRIYQWGVAHICTLFSDVLYWDKDWLTSEVLREYADAVWDASAPYVDCFGFVDGTVWQICRPLQYQRQLFNGHHQLLALKFHRIMAPDRIMIHLRGPFNSPFHAITLWKQSGIKDLLVEHAFGPNGEILFVYGDPGYSGKFPHIQYPFKLAFPMPEQHACNVEMSQHWICVEWGWGKAKTEFATLDWRQMQKVLLSPIALYFCCGILLTNAHTCLYRSETLSHFRCCPPLLEHYLRVNQ
ncbi:hypothetical protein M427DRAFT_103967 [Gonapodya prolifera JEL478]|uniref:DDE Tnp4 domain-containing protein n=1 Tax=Gonapodya prolifera (strain JEL478) TaxID=1344416 RepID=A0A139A0F4_GONPJ|nr:hypothetical protein M427DRAFT_103967 [Gonapodya prolifera JEL478]|eukprot:KXS10250.1 hypothetical protein M427DRAFT_103967 [Gonapodya prolifera JEL478]